MTGRLMLDVNVVYVKIYAARRCLWWSAGPLGPLRTCAVAPPSSDATGTEHGFMCQVLPAACRGRRRQIPRRLTQLELLHFARRGLG